MATQSRTDSHERIEKDTGTRETNSMGLQNEHIEIHFEKNGVSSSSGVDNQGYSYGSQENLTDTKTSQQNNNNVHHLSPEEKTHNNNVGENQNTCNADNSPMGRGRKATLQLIQDSDGSSKESASSIDENWVISVNETSSKTYNEFKVRESKRFSVSYENVVWFLFALTTVLCIVDRFVNSGDVVLGRKGKKVSRIWGTNFGETTTNIVWAVTARLIITSQNLMFYTTLWCIPNLISEMAPRFLKICGIRDINIKIHRIAGIFLIAIPSLAHVLVIFVPPIIDRTKLTYSPPSDFNYSNQLGHLNWSKIWDPAAVENWTFNDKFGVHLTSDEIYRLSLMIALFMVLFPLSRSKFLNDRSYSVAMVIHAFAGIWYAIDNIRKITHGLAHVFNLPLLILWCIDRLISIHFYRSNKADIKSDKLIGNHKYVVLKLKLPRDYKRSVGDVYYLSIKDRLCSFLSCERAHPFTSFSNHGADKSWDIGFIISVMDDQTQWFPSWTRQLTKKIESIDQPNLNCWGPYRSSAFELYNELMNNERKSYTLFASGSGFGYLLDVLGLLAYQVKPDVEKIPHIDIHYTASEMSLISHFQQQVEMLIGEIQYRNTATITFNWYSTDSAKNGEFSTHSNDAVSYNKGRIDFAKVVRKMDKQSCAYFVGRPALADVIQKICDENDVPLVKDYVNSSRGKSDKLIIVSYLKKTLFVMTLTAIICFVIAIYKNH